MRIRPSLCQVTGQTVKMGIRTGPSKEKTHSVDLGIALPGVDLAWDIVTCARVWARQCTSLKGASFQPLVAHRRPAQYVSTSKFHA